MSAVLTSWCERVRLSRRVAPDTLERDFANGYLFGSACSAASASRARTSSAGAEDEEEGEEEEDLAGPRRLPTVSAVPQVV